MSQGPAKPSVFLYDANGSPIVLGQSTPTGSLPFVQPSGVFDAGNSTTVPPGDGSINDGVPIDVTGYASIAVFMEIDPWLTGSSIVVFVEFSSDGVFWATVTDRTIPSIAQTLTAGFTFSRTVVVAVRARYMRVRWIYIDSNASTPTAFRLQTYLFQQSTSETTVLLSRLPAELTAAGNFKNDITTWFGSNAATLGSKTQVNSIPVVLASDQTQLPTTLGTKVSANSFAVTHAEDPTYAACSGPFAAAATPTDVFTITGSASRIIIVRKIVVTATQTTAGYVRMSIVKRSADNTAGTSTAATKVPYDSNYAGATNTVRHYTVNPTSLGAVIGSVCDDKIFVPVTTVVANPPQVWNFTEDDSPGIRLRGVAEILALNLNAITISGNSFNVRVEWGEVAP